MSLALPDLSALGAKYQDAMRPEDAALGTGIADWTISYEWDPDPKSSITGKPIWGCMCSPSILEKEGVRAKLAPEDIEAKRAHIVVRLPKNERELKEAPRTVFHEQGHILLAALNLPRDKEEEIMHSLDHVFKKLSPDQAMALARAFQDPMARVYRAEESPDMADEKKEPDKGNEDKKAPAMAEGAPRDVATIQGEIAKAALAGQPVDELAKELALALVAAGSAAGNGAAMPVAPDSQTMGMKPEEGYARAKKEAEAAAEVKAVKAYAESIEGITPEQRAEIADAPSMERAQRLLKTYPRESLGATLGVFPGKKTPGAKPAQSVRERAMSADADVMERVQRASSKEDTAGLVLDIPGHSVGWSPTQWLKEQLGQHERRMKAQQEAGQ